MGSYWVGVGVSLVHDGRGRERGARCGLALCTHSQSACWQRRYGLVALAVVKSQTARQAEVELRQRQEREVLYDSDDDGSSYSYTSEEGV